MNQENPKCQSRTRGLDNNLGRFEPILALTPIEDELDAGHGDCEKPEPGPIEAGTLFPSSFRQGGPETEPRDGADRHD